RAPPFTLPLTGRVSEAVPNKNAPDGMATLGVRSEHVLVSSQSQPETIEARVLFIEPVGSDMFVSLQIGDQHCVARTEPRSDLQEGAPVWLRFVPEKLHLFDQAGHN